MSGIKPGPFLGFKVQANAAIDLKVQASGQTVQGQNSSTWIPLGLLSRHWSHFSGAPKNSAKSLKGSPLIGRA